MGGMNYMSRTKGVAVVIVGILLIFKLFIIYFSVCIIRDYDMLFKLLDQLFGGLTENRLLVNLNGYG